MGSFHAFATRPPVKPTSPFLPLVRELVRTYQAFERLSAGHVRSMGLTPAQFDVVATLGNTEGMNPKQLGEKTLITKGTLTGVVDRLLDKGLVQRLPDPHDGRGQIVRLTEKGQALFETVFPAHVAYMAKALSGFDSARLAPTQQALHALRQVLEQAGGTEDDA